MNEANNVLLEAEKGMLDSNILQIRTAGTVFCKEYPKEQMVGSKNAVRRAKNLMKENAKNDLATLPGTLQKTLLDNVNAYEQAEKEVIDAGQATVSRVERSQRAGQCQRFAAACRQA